MTDYTPKYRLLKTIAVFIILCINPGFSYAKELQVGSWGGNVRSGPGTNYSKIGILGNGDPVVILKKIKTGGNDFPWFKIRLTNGATGFQWGGVLCGYSREISGTFGVCKQDNRSTPRNYTCSEQNSIRSLNNKINTKVTFFSGQTMNKFEIYWIDYNGNKQLVEIIGAEDSITMNTFLSHPWLILSVSPNGTKTCHSLVRGSSMQSHWLLR